jgi:hypothetical protein
MIRMELGATWYTCPKSWQNFIEAFNAEDFGYGGDVPLECVQSNLIPYRAKYEEDKTGSAYLVFEEEKYYTMFALRWS